MAEQENQRSSRSASSWIAMLLSLAALVVAGFVGFLWQESTGDVASINKDIAALSQRLKAHDSTRGNTEEAFTQRQRTQEDNLEQLRSSTMSCSNFSRIDRPPRLIGCLQKLSTCCVSQTNEC